MIVRWLIGVCATFSIVACARWEPEQPSKLLNRRNVTEKTGMPCAYADFNKDRLTDILHYHKGKLYVLLQGQEDFTKEDDEKTQSLMIDLGGEYAEVACSVGDINNDGMPDVVVSTRKAKGDNSLWTVRYFTMTKANENEKKEIIYKFEEGRTNMKAKHQVALIDVTGDGIHDIMGIEEDGFSLLCLKGITMKEAEAGENPFHKGCGSMFDNFTGSIHPLMPILYGDIDNDLYSELILMKQTGDQVWPEIWHRPNDTRQKWVNLIEFRLPELPNGEKFTHTLAPLLVDMDLNAKMDLIVPTCRDKECTMIDNLQTIHWEGKEKGWGEGWKAIQVELGGKTIVAEEDTLVRMKAGDVNLDGYPDIVVTIGSTTGPSNYAAVLENQLADNETPPKRKFVMPSKMMIMPGLALGMIQSSSFFDFAEDGFLDVLVQWKLREGDDWQWSLCASESDTQGDVTFLKVQTVAPLHEDIKYGKGVVWGGVCVSYQMETTGIGEKRMAIECQVPANSHKAGLSPPFVLFGLGRSPNFIDNAYIGVPRDTNDKALKMHEQKQIVPNARMIVQPPLERSNGWVLRLYLTPSNLIYSSLIVMASTCTILLIVVLALHFREKKVDRVERAAQSHRFHFDAM